MAENYRPKVIVTGAAGHIGSAISSVLNLSGADLVLVGSNIDKLRALQNELRPSFSTSHAYCVDLSHEDERDKFIDRVKQEHEYISGIVNNAYSGRAGTVRTSSCDDFRRAYEIGLIAPFHLTKAFTECLLRAVQYDMPASIVNIGSMYGHISPDLKIYDSEDTSNPPFYGAAKAALIQLTRYSATELGAKGIRCNSVSPGPIPNNKVQKADPAFIGRLVKKVPMDRIGHPLEVAHAVAFLLSASASFVNGSDLKVDGGWTSW